jgi:hypothetical protein
MEPELTHFLLHKYVGHKENKHSSIFLNAYFGKQIISCCLNTLE